MEILLKLVQILGPQLLLQNRKFKKIFSFEPSLENIRLAKANLALNDALDTVYITPKVNFHQTTKMYLSIDNDNKGDHRVSKDKNKR